MDLMAVARLMRLENDLMAGMAVAVGYVVAGGTTLSVGIILAFLAVILITGAGNTINDYYDRGVDKENSPERPIPSGRTSPKQALYLAVALFFSGVAISYFINPLCFALALFNSVLLFIYARSLKSSVFYGNLSVSYLTASTFFYGSLVLGVNSAVIFLALLAFLANVGREIIGDIEDIEGDKKGGVKTLAILVGAGRAWLYGRLYILFAVLLSPLPYLAGLLSLYYLIFVSLADAVFLLSIATRNPRKNQKLTKVAILLALVAFFLGSLLP